MSLSHVKRHKFFDIFGCFFFAVYQNWNVILHTSDVCVGRGDLVGSGTERVHNLVIW